MEHVGDPLDLRTREMPMNTDTPLRPSTLRWFVALMMLLLAWPVPVRGDVGENLESMFRFPAESAKPWVFWYWMQGNISREGITADLEAMREADLGGAYLMPIQGPREPLLMTPPVVQLTPEFWAMVRHAIQEAGRLGLQIGMHACDGFAVAGGPWITPELSMQRVVWTETSATGGRPITESLPRPEANEGYYRDIAVLAYPSPDGTGISTRSVVPRVTSSVSGQDAGLLVQPGNTRAFRSEEPCWIQYAFDDPFTCRSITIHPDGNNFQSKRLVIEVSDDGRAFRKVQALEPPRHGWQDSGVPLTYAIVPVTGRYFRFVHDPSGSEPGSEDLDSAKWKPVLKIKGIELSGAPRINQFEAKSARVWRVAARTTATEVPDALCVPLDQIVDLTGRMDAEGRLEWDVPAGRWAVLRIGHTSTGQENETGGGGRGLECDKFNLEAVRFQFDQWFGEALRQAGPGLAGRVLSVLHVDSWECGSQNWSPVFRSEFQRRRGYDLLNYLPAMAGIPVQSADISERFLHDVRQTIAELVADRFYGTLRQMAHKAGCRFTGECTAPTMTGDGLLHFQELDVPMGEFWLRSPTHDKPNDMRDAISGAHLYGKPVVQAEAFTELRIGWDEHPGMLKALGDRNYCLGINRFVYHVFTHNPWLDRKPGMTLNGVGLFFQQNQTWWQTGKAWVDYAQRCQGLLQQGRPVVDVAVFTGEELPRRAVLPERLVPTLPGLFGEAVVQAEAQRLANAGEPQRAMPEGVRHSANMADPEDWIDPLRGYAYDSMNPDALLRLASVRNGRIELPGGASYGVLVVPGPRPMSPDANAMSVEVAEKLQELVQAGATVLLTSRPQRIPGMADQSKGPADLDRVVETLWPSSINPGSSIEFGAGRVCLGAFREDSFAGLGLDRDVWITDEGGRHAGNVAWTHRTTGDAEIYFLSNQLDDRRDLDVSLRTAGRRPELWNPVTGEQRSASQWRICEERTVLPVRLEPRESVFVVLRQSTELTEQRDGSNWLEPVVSQELRGVWRVAFAPADAEPQAPRDFAELVDWSARPEAEIRHCSGVATYRQAFEWAGGDSKSGRMWLDLGRVDNLAAVTLNGVDCGTAWTPPFRVEITDALRTGENRLEIRVANTWHNRLVLEAGLPEAKQTTWMNAPNRLKGKPLLPAGLLGPVTILTEP